jgi:deazaflavin-dependent oxidoreductase (nitroreductase family)
MSEEYCYLTTVGRRTGRPHTIELWFAARGDTLYLISGGGDRSDWVRNLQADGAAIVRVGEASGPMDYAISRRRSRPGAR